MTDQILNAIKSLSVDEKIELVSQICNSIAEETQAADLSPELRDELDRRLAEMEDDPMTGLTLDEFRALLQRSR